MPPPYRGNSLGQSYPFRCLRTGRARRRPQGLTVMNGQGKIRGMVNIAERPAEADDRAVPATGRATSSSAPAAAPSPPWSGGIAGS
jgi:hypothetical protein